MQWYLLLSLSYQKLCLANGGRRRELAIEGAKLPGVLGLRTIEDALQLRTRLQAGQHLVIIGGGFTNYNGIPRNNIARLNADYAVASLTASK